MGRAFGAFDFGRAVNLGYYQMVNMKHAFGAGLGVVRTANRVVGMDRAFSAQVLSPALPRVASFVGRP